MCGSHAAPYTTCCLLDVDGLRQGWENGVPSFWETDRNGDLDLDDMPDAICRLHGSYKYSSIISEMRPL
jgi:hypothetical protein